MLALVLDPTLRLAPDWPHPQLTQGTALIRPLLVGICKTDLELVKGYMQFHGVLGHEFVGIVEACEDPSWLGQRVVGEINCAPFGTSTQDPRHLPGRSVLGILNHDGVMAQQFRLPIDNLLRVPPTLDDRAAVFTEPLAAAYEIIEQLNPLPQEVLIFGDGKLGSLCALALHESNCSVTLVGKHSAKLKQLPPGITTETLSNLANIPTDFPLVIDATGSPLGLELALNHVRPRGTIVIKTTVTAPHHLNLAPVVINELTLLGSRCGRFAPALQALSKKRIDPSFLIEDVFWLKDALAAFERAARPGAGKILLQIPA